MAQSIRSYSTREALRGLKSILQQADRDGHVLLRRHDGACYVVTRVPGIPDAATVAATRLAGAGGRGRRGRGSTPDAVLALLQPQLATLAPSVQAGLRRHVAEPRSLSVPKFARSVGIMRRTLDRRVRRAGIDGTARLLKGGATAAIWDVLVANDGDLKRAARQTRFPKRVIQRLMRQYVGASTRRSMMELTNDQIARRIARNIAAS
ncbi:MAG TPA: hypothetical protein VG916_07575 [Gemmatimonadaceae bacterium]|nr:hypothetical protein [Gemmatimonadaceae bacterium]